MVPELKLFLQGGRCVGDRQGLVRLLSLSTSQGCRELLISLVEVIPHFPELR